MGLIKRFSNRMEKVEHEERAGKKESYPVLRYLYMAFRFVQITVREIVQDQIPLKSMALTFATLLSLVPLLAISFSLFRLFGGAEWFVETLRPMILDFLAPGTGPKVAERMQELVENAGSATLGGLGVTLLVLAVYAIFSGIESALNAIWGSHSRAGSLQRLPLYWGLVTIVPILVVGSLAVTTYLQAVPIVGTAVSKVNIGDALLNRLLSMGMVVVGFFLLYKFVPSTKVKTTSALLGAVIAGLLYEVVKAGFIIYTTDLVKYDVIYGSLATIPLLLIWVNLSWIVLLGGVEISFVSQHFGVLLRKPKHVRLSRHQRDAVAYLLLREVTAAFHGERDEVILADWADNWNVPPGLAEETADSLQKGGLIERTGRSFSTVLLARSPDKVTLEEVENLLSNSASSEWRWPDEGHWGWLRDWMRQRESASLKAASFSTLDDLVRSMSDAIRNDGQGKPKKKAPRKRAASAKKSAKDGEQGDKASPKKSGDE